MLKKRSKVISMLIALAFLFTMIMPGLAFAGTYADASYSTAQGVDTDTTALGFVKLDDFTDADVVYITVELPDGVEFDGAYDPAAMVTVDGSGAAVVAAAPLSSDDDSFTITVGTAAVPFDADWVKISFADDMVIKSSAPDDIEATVTIQASEDNGGGDQVLAWGPESFECLIGVQGDAEVTVDVASAKPVSVGSDQAIAKITFEESMAGALAVGDVFELELPDGFEWDTDCEGALDAGPYSLAGTAAIDADDEELLTIEITAVSDPFADELKFSGLIKVYPDAAEGDVEVDITTDFVGGADFDDVSVVVAYMGDAEGTLTIEDEFTDDLYVGDLGKYTSTFTIEATTDFVEGDDIRLELDGGAIWCIPDEAAWTALQGAGKASADLDYLGTYDGSKGLWLTANTDVDEIEMTLPIGAYWMAVPGEVTMSLTGDYDADAIVVQEIKYQLEVSADAPAIQLGSLGQDAGDITLVETEKDALTPFATSNPAYDEEYHSFITLSLPTGVYFAGEPTILINGTEEAPDLTMDFDYDADDKYNAAADFGDAFEAGSSNIVIDFYDYDDFFRDNKIDTITITDIVYDFDTRYRAAGDVEVEIGGALVNDWMVASSESGRGHADEPVYTVVNAVAGDANAAASVFTIGAATYTINGVEYTMDVSPYISGDRTFMPIRYAAYALGITDANILWDGTAQTVTLIKGDKVVQLQVGSTALLINGASVTMDVAPQIVDPGRVCLPIRFVAQAFGAEVGWDAATQQVTIDL